MNIIDKVFGTHSERELKRLSRLLRRLRATERLWVSLQMKNFAVRQQSLRRG